MLCIVLAHISALDGPEMFEYIFVKGAILFFFMKGNGISIYCENVFKYFVGKNIFNLKLV